MSTGTVKWFDVKKGFGFIVNGDGKDVFVHFSSIEGDGFRTLKDGETVEYEQVDSGKGLAARNVKRVKPSSGADGSAMPAASPAEDPGQPSAHV